MAEFPHKLKLSTPTSFSPCNHAGFPILAELEFAQPNWTKKKNAKVNFIVK
jgi:hypothetical protein